MVEKEKEGLIVGSPLCEVGRHYVLEPVDQRVSHITLARRRLSHKYNATSKCNKPLGKHAHATVVTFNTHRNGLSETECTERVACVSRAGKKQAGDNHHCLTETSLAYPNESSR